MVLPFARPRALQGAGPGRETDSNAKQFGQFVQTTTLTGPRPARPRRLHVPAAELLNYVRTPDLEVGVLLNFGLKPEFKRLVLDNASKTNRRGN